MEIKFTIEGTERLTQALAKVPEAVQRRLKIAMEAAARDVAEYARTHHRFISRAGGGALEGAIEDSVHVDGMTITGEVRLNPANTMTKDGRSYGIFQHDGTRDHYVAPVNRKVLRWVGPGGKFAYSKGHKVRGIKPDPFIYNAGTTLQRSGLLQAAFGRQIELALKEAGV